MKDVIKCHEEGFKYRQGHYPELFDLDFWRNTEEFKLLLEYTDPDDEILEVGCLTGHHLINLQKYGYTKLTGVDFVSDAIKWANTHSEGIKFVDDIFYGPDYAYFSKIILFDVLEHVHNIEEFLMEIEDCLFRDDGEVLIVVPKGDNYPSEGHVNFYPNEQCLRQLLDFYFEVIETKEIDNGKKIFARCKRRD